MQILYLQGNGGNVSTADSDNIEIYDEDGELSVNLDDGSYAVVYYGTRKQVLAQLIDHAGERDVTVRETASAFRHARPRQLVAYFSGIELAPTAQRRGRGTRLVELLLAACRARGVKLIVLHALDSAAFWRKLGFVELAPADREQHYMPGMTRQLGATSTLRRFHVSSSRNRASIQRQGLLLRYCFNDGLTPIGIYFTEHAAEAAPAEDVWAADLTGYVLHDDPFCGEDSALGSCVYVTRDVLPNRLRLVNARQQLGAAAWDPAYGQSPPYARDYARARVPVTQIASPFMNPISQDRVDELAELEAEGYDLPPVIVDGPSEVEEVDYPEEKYPFLDGHYPEVGEDVWYVHDGHHRVTLAIQQGRRFVDALVTS